MLALHGLLGVPVFVVAHVELFVSRVEGGAEKEKEDAEVAHFLEPAIRSKDAAPDDSEFFAGYFLAE